MKPIDFVIIAIVVLILGAAVFYIRKAKKKGLKCIGCPDASGCAERCAGCSGHCCGSSK